MERHFLLCSIVLFAAVIVVDIAFFHFHLIFFLFQFVHVTATFEQANSRFWCQITERNDAKKPCPCSLFMLWLNTITDWKMRFIHVILSPFRSGQTLVLCHDCVHEVLFRNEKKRGRSRTEYTQTLLVSTIRYVFALNEQRKARLWRIKSCN